MSASTLSPQAIAAIDQHHIWHPYTSFASDNPVYTVQSANGVELTLENGTRLIDGMASWWSVIHGYNHPVLNRALKSQIDNFAHVMFGGLTHEPAARLAKTLVALSPAGLDKVFYSDSGSVAVEVAIKMAVQFWLSQGQPQRHKLLALRQGYHGDTFAAMSVCDPVNGMHHFFNRVLPKQFFCDAPQCRFDQQWEEHFFDDFKRTLSCHQDQIAAVILEPIAQGAGGMWFYSPVFLQRVREWCDKTDTLLIADEIATGFGRTGKMFACQHADISPDILCLGKALTGGYMSFAATLCNNKVAYGISDGAVNVLMHGPTFMANPLACAVANASIELLLSQDWQTKIKAIEKQLTAQLAPCAVLDQVADVRVLGAIGVVELKKAVDLKTIQPMFVNEGVWLRPFGKLVYMLPPYTISADQLTILTQATYNVVSSYRSPNSQCALV